MTWRFLSSVFPGSSVSLTRRSRVDLALLQREGFKLVEVVKKTSYGEGSLRFIAQQ